MIGKKLCELCTCIWMILLVTACTAEPAVEQVTIVPRTPMHTPTSDSTPTHTAVLPTPFPTHSPTPTTASKATATTEPTPTTEPTSTINLDGITQVAQWGRGNVYDVTYSADGRLHALYIMSASGTYIHDLQDPNGIQQKFDSELPVLLSPDGETAVIGQEVWNLNDNELLFTIPTDAIETEFLQNGDLLAIKTWADEGGLSVQLWSLPDAQLIYTFKNSQQIKISPDEKTILTADYTGDFETYAWPSLAEQKHFLPVDVDSREMTEYLASNAAFSPDGQTVALAWESVNSWNAEANVVEIRDLSSDTTLLTIPSIEPWGYKELKFSCDEEPFLLEGPGAPRPTGIEFSANGQFISVIYNDLLRASDKAESLINVYRVSDGALVQSFADGEYIAFSPDGETVTVSTVLGDVQVWSLADFVPVHDIVGYSGPVRRIQFSPDSQIAAVEYMDGTRLQQVSDGTVITEYANGRATFAPDGETVAVGYADGHIEWRQLDDNTLLNTFTGHTARVNDLVFLPSGLLVTVGDDCLMAAWNPANGTRQLQFEDYLTPSQFEAPDVRAQLNHLLAIPSSNIVAGSPGYSVSLWQTDDGKLVQTFSSQSSPGVFSLPGGEVIVRPNEPELPLSFWESTNKDLLSPSLTSFAFSPDGTVAALGNNNGSVRLQDAQIGVALRTLRSPDQSKVTALAFSPDGRYLLVGSAGGLLTIWEMPIP